MSKCSKYCLNEKATLNVLSFQLFGLRIKHLQLALRKLQLLTWNYIDWNISIIFIHWSIILVSCCTQYLDTETSCLDKEKDDDRCLGKIQVEPSSNLVNFLLLLILTILLRKDWASTDHVFSTTNWIALSPL